MKPYEIANLKNVSIQTVYRWIRTGIIPKKKIKKIQVSVQRIEIEKSVLNNELKYYPK